MDPPRGDQMPENKKTEVTFWQHLAELLNRLRNILYSLIISTIIVMGVPISLSSPSPFYTTITSFVIKNLQERFLTDEVELLPVSLIAPLEVYVQISVILGIIMSLPVISYELYKFFNPALYEREKKSISLFVLSFVGLYIFGFVLGYLYIVPITIRTLFSFSRLLFLPPIYDFAEFFSVVGMTLLTSGLIFTMPLYLIILVKVGIIRTDQIRKNRKYLYGGLVILIAIIDPEPGLVTEFLVFIPLLILIEISILIAKRMEKTLT